jgi:hypothetical protein
VLLGNTATAAAREPEGEVESADAAPPKRRRVASSGGRPRDDAGWEARLAKLEAYKRRHGDFNVPQGWAENLRLATWVNNQRALKRKLDRGEPSQGMTVERAAKLEALGLDWAPQHRGEAGGEAGAAGSSTSRISDIMMPATFDCGACGKEEQRHTWFDGWGGSCYQGKCERCYLSSAAINKQQKNYQRRYGKRALDCDKPSQRMTAERAAMLEESGFAWELSTAAHNSPHRTRADETAEALEVEAVIGKRRGKARRGSHRHLTADESYFRLYGASL